MGLWTLRCQFPQTVTAIAFESQGLFEQVSLSLPRALLFSLSPLITSKAYRQDFAVLFCWGGGGGGDNVIPRCAYSVGTQPGGRGIPVHPLLYAILL